VVPEQQKYLKAPAGGDTIPILLMNIILSNGVINNLDHISAEFCAGQTFFNNPSVLTAAINRF
jgi:hypothetical protein